MTALLLGPGRLWIHDRPVRIARRKSWELLALLCLKPGWVDRSFLSQTLWGADDVAHRDCLRNELSHLRKALGSQGKRLETDNMYASFNADGTAIDVMVLDALGRRNDEASLANAIRVYGGALLAGYDGLWLSEYRAPLEQKYLDAVEQYAEILIERGDTASALFELARAIVIDPTREGLRQCTMRAFAGRGEYAAAIREYRSFCDCLAKEIREAAPSPETCALFHQIKRDARAAMQRLHRRRPAA